MRGGRIVIVGGGIAGAALAYALAEAGHTDVILVERERAPGQHSTARNAAILRTAIAARATRVLARETAVFLRRPPHGFSDHALLDACGLIVCEGAPGEPEPDWSRAASTDEVRRLDPGELARLAPHFRPAGERAWFLPREGRIDIAALLDGFLRVARRAGIEIRTDAPVQALVSHAGTVRGVTLRGGERIEADWTVIAAGGWAARLGASAAEHVELNATRRHLLVTGVDPAVDERWPIVWDDCAGFYARPESGGLLVCACDQTDVDPDRCVSDPSVKEAVASKVATHLPAFADASAAHFWSGLRTLTPDDVPLIGPDASLPGLFWLAGLGGHGMTTSHAVGTVAARLLTGAAVDSELEQALRPNRFAGAAPRSHAAP